jgi:hypothetical protein
MDKTKIFIIIGAVALAAGFWAWQSGVFSSLVKPVPIPEGIILFYGEGCSHCKNVDDFLTQNKIEEKIKITRLEVWNNKDNQNILAQVSQKCQINASEVRVPFLWDPPRLGEAGGSKCYIGDVDTINFFKEKFKL